jgi:hypothetical protein
VIYDPRDRTDHKHGSGGVPAIDGRTKGLGTLRLLFTSSAPPFGDPKADWTGSHWLTDVWRGGEDGGENPIKVCNSPGVPVLGLQEKRRRRRAKRETEVIAGATTASRGHLLRGFVRDLERDGAGKLYATSPDWEGRRGDGLK